MSAVQCKLRLFGVVELSAAARPPACLPACLPASRLPARLPECLQACLPQLPADSVASHSPAC